MKKILSFALAALLVTASLPAVAHGAELSAERTAAVVLVDGVELAFDAYTINQNTYFKLRDLAYILRNTEKRFSVMWNSVEQAIYMVSGGDYTAVGGEMAVPTGAGVGTAVPYTAAVILDGESVAWSPYTIGENNYFRLRDLGYGLDFGVDWDGTRDTVSISTSKGYTAELTDAATPASGPTADAVYQSIMALKETYPEALPWDEDNYYEWKGGIFSGGYACAAFAFILSDAAFGDAPAREHTDVNNLKMGDILRIDNNSHSVVVIGVTETNITVAEGNYNRSVHWGRTFSRESLSRRLTYVLTRYPEG